MNFYSIIIYGYIALASFLFYIIWRDSKKEGSFFNNKKPLSIILCIILSIGILMAVEAYFIEPNLLLIKNTKIESNKISNEIKIALITDIQVGNHKKEKFVQKLVQKINTTQPDLILLGGDLIDNEGNFDHEEEYLNPLKKLVGKYPIYYILGNHEYGIGSYLQNDPNKHTADKSNWLIKKMEELGIPLLRNTLDCLEIKNQEICIFGTDDIWKHKINYTILHNCHPEEPKDPLKNNCNLQNKFLIFLTHNPDGILSYPKDLTPPDLVLAGHTHGGQIYLPFIGPLGDPDVKLPKKYWRELNYYNNIPILTSIGVGESGGKLRFLSPPTIDIIIVN